MITIIIYFAQIIIIILRIIIIKKVQYYLEKNRRQCMLSKFFFISAFILCVTQPAAFAQTDDPIELMDISIIGTKNERLTDEIPASITVIKEDRLDKEIAWDISDLVRYEPGISLSGTGSRFYEICRQNSAISKRKNRKNYQTGRLL